MQLLTLVAQNSFSQKLVGTATAGQNYFRQVGATLGSAVVGALFASRLGSLLAERLPAGAVQETDLDPSSLTPEAVGELPASLHSVVIEGYNDALVPLFLWMAPLVLVSTVLLLFVEEKPLETSLEH